MSPSVAIVLIILLIIVIIAILLYKNLDRTYRFLLTIIVMVIIVMRGRALTMDFIRDMIAKKALEKVVSSEISSDKLSSIIDIISDNEKDTIKNIVNNHVDALFNINEIKELAKSKSISKIKDFIKSELSEDELKDIKDIYRNHKEEINDIIRESEDN